VGTVVPVPRIATYSGSLRPLDQSSPTNAPTRRYHSRTLIRPSLDTRAFSISLALYTQFNVPPDPRGPTAACYRLASGSLSPLRVWFSRRAGGRPAGVMSGRVILLRCFRIRDATGPANLCTGGRLPSNGEICIRYPGGAAGGHVVRTRCVQLHASTLAASAAILLAGRLPARARVAALAVHGRHQRCAYRCTPGAGRCCVGRGAVCDAARTWRVDAGTQFATYISTCI